MSLILEHFSLWAVILGFGFFFTILIIAFFIMFITSLSLLFVLKALLLSFIAKQKGMKNSYIAWFPVINLYLLFEFSGVLVLPSLIFLILTILFPSIILLPFILYVLYAMVKLLKKLKVENSLLIFSILFVWIFPFLLTRCFYLAYKNLKNNYN